jgi:hypothetical protein
MKRKKAKTLGEIGSELRKIMPAADEPSISDRDLKKIGFVRLRGYLLADWACHDVAAVTLYNDVFSGWLVSIHMLNGTVLTFENCPGSGMTLELPERKPKAEPPHGAVAKKTKKK